jgi:hypothetical protein
MTYVETSRGIALSPNAVSNGWPMPSGKASRIHRESGDYAESSAGRMRRADRKARLAFKRSGIEG